MSKINDAFIDKCKLLGIYDDKEVYLYTSCKYDCPRIFFSPNYYFLPSWADPDKLTLFQAVKIINYRLKHNNSDNMKLETINIDTLIEEWRDN